VSRKKLSFNAHQNGTGGVYVHANDEGSCGGARQGVSRLALAADYDLLLSPLR